MTPKTMLLSGLWAAFSCGLAWALTSPGTLTALPGAYLIELNPGTTIPDILTEIGPWATTRMHLDYKLFQGLSIHIDDAQEVIRQTERLGALDGVRAIYQVRAYAIPNAPVHSTGGGSNPTPSQDIAGVTSQVNTSRIMTQIDRLQKLGITGKGVRVAVIDTGIDYTHPALGGCFGEGCLVAFGTDLVGDTYTGSNMPIPDSDPRDCAGHGTHVAGIIAAQPNKLGFVGSAPGVTLGIFKVFGCTGFVATDVLIAAYNKAYEAGSHIITASIGGSSGWNEDPWAVAVQRIVNAGVPCTLAAGNDGAEGLFFASGAADGKNVTSIAAIENTITPILLTLSLYTVASGTAQTFGWVPGIPAAWANVSLPLYYNASFGDGCKPFPGSAPDLSGFIVLIERSTCTFAIKAANAAAAGVRYLMLYNNMQGAFSVEVPGIGLLGVAMVQPEVASPWISAIQAGKQVKLYMQDPLKAVVILEEQVDNENGGALDTFTSWGPTYEGNLKPELAAVGGSVLSTWPLSLGGYAVLSGTSMATPQAAAALALLAQYRGTTDPEVLTVLLATTARPVVYNNGTAWDHDGRLAPVPQQGNGLMQVFDAAMCPVILSVSSLSFNDSAHSPPAGEPGGVFTITNPSAHPLTFHLSSKAALTAFTYSSDKAVTPAGFPVPLDSSHATINFQPPECVTVPAKGTATVKVFPTAPVGLDPALLPIWSGWVTLTEKEHGTMLRLAYQGITGSLAAQKVVKEAYLANSSSAAVANDDPNNPAPLDASQTFVLPSRFDNVSQPLQLNVALPYMFVNLSFGSPLLRVDVVPLNPGPLPANDSVLGLKTLGQPSEFDGRWSSRGPQYAVWDGKLDSGVFAPAGAYMLVARALRVFGDPSSVTDYERVDSVPFKISYTSA